MGVGGALGRGGISIGRGAQCRVLGTLQGLEGDEMWSEVTVEYYSSDLDKWLTAYSQKLSVTYRGDTVIVSGVRHEPRRNAYVFIIEAVSKAGSEIMPKISVEMVMERMRVLSEENKRFRAALEEIRAAACGENQVAETEGDGLQWIYRRAEVALGIRSEGEEMDRGARERK